MDISREYIFSLEENEKQKILSLFNMFLKLDYISNEQKFKYLQGSDGIYEFKSYNHRILCFYLPKRQPKSLIITHGFKKQRANTPKEQIEKAEQIKRKLILLDKTNKLIIKEE